MDARGTDLLSQEHKGLIDLSVRYGLYGWFNGTLRSVQEARPERRRSRGSSRRGAEGFDECEGTIGCYSKIRWRRMGPPRRTSLSKSPRVELQDQPPRHAQRETNLSHFRRRHRAPFRRLPERNARNCRPTTRRHQKRPQNPLTSSFPSRSEALPLQERRQSSVARSVTDWPAVATHSIQAPYRTRRARYALLRCT